MNGFFSLAILLAFVSVTACGYAQADTAATQTVDVREFAALLESERGVLVDVRTPEEYKAGYIDGALLINFFDADFEQRIDSLDTKTPVFVYCRSGGRSAKAMELMRTKGFSRVYNLDGGYEAWKRQRE